MLKLGSEIINNRFTANATFGNNSWAIIKQVAQTGVIPASWAVGDTKEFVGKDGNTYHAMIYDKQAGRYAYSDSSGRRSNIVIGFVELPNIVTVWNTSNTNSGGLADSQIRKNLNGLEGFQTDKNFMTQIIPDDLAAILVEVDITTASTGSSWDSSKMKTSANKLFPPCFINVKTSTTPQYVAEGTLWDWYATHTTDADRKKALVTSSTSYKNYWTASPYSDSSSRVYGVDYDGFMLNTSTGITYYVAPCFAF